MKFKFATFSIITIIFAVGCSGEPSESDIRNALQRESAETSAFIGGKKNSLAKTEIHSVEIIGCKEATDSTGFYCDYELDMTVPLFGRHKGLTRDLFVKSDSGWVRMKK